jgi:uncharacterized membrane protein YgdD (TMEM256/DUF423 family)
MNWILIAAVFGFSTVALGAFGAHALKDRLGDSMPTWQTAVLYHMVHTLAILVLALYARTSQQNLNLPAGFFAAGILLFSGSLYALSLTGIKPLGAVTPFGGLCFLAGWVALAIWAWRLRGG